MESAASLDGLLLERRIGRGGEQGYCVKIVIPPQSDKQNDASSTD